MRLKPVFFPLLQLVLVLLLLRDFLWQREWIISTNEGGDVFVQFYAWRQFAVQHLLGGEFPFWNPHIFGGIPFFGGMQSALLYPLNALFLFLPVAVAINWSIALHLWLMGLFTTLWLRHGLRLGHAAAGMGGVMMMFSGPFFMHIHGGQLTNLSVMIWVPLLLLACDRWFAEGDRRWLALGALLVALQIFAGHPQYLYYSGLTLLLYTAVQLWRQRENRYRNAGGIALIYLIGALLGAVQLLPGVEAASASVRGGGVSTAFAGEGSLPPAYLTTLLAPHLLDLAPDKAWLWETTLYFGVLGLGLAVIGLGFRDEPRTKALALLTLLLMVLALGRYTPLFPLLMKWLPGFNLFRGTTKFAFFAVLFAVALAALGIERLRQQPAATARQFVAPLLVCAIGLGIAWLALLALADGESRNALFAHPDAGGVITSDLLMATLLLGLAAPLMWWHSRGGRAMLVVLLGLLTLELYLDAATHLPRFKESEILHHPIVEALRAQPGEKRVLNLDYRNAAILTGGYELWGNDPGISKRWAEFVAATQGMPAPENQNIYFASLAAPLAIARLDYQVRERANGLNFSQADTTPFPRARLFHAVEVRARERLLERLTDPAFDFTHTVLVEEPLGVAADATGDGSVSLLSSTVNTLELHAQTSAPAVLLITDAYDKGWRALNLNRDNPHEYRIIPADHAFIGIPLTPGAHHLRLEYRPRSLSAGLWLSLLGFVLWLFLSFRRSPRPVKVATL